MKKRGSKFENGKPYRAPVLVRYGRIEAVTTGGTGAATDGKGRSMTSKMG